MYIFNYCYRDIPRRAFHVECLEDNTAARVTDIDNINNIFTIIIKKTVSSFNFQVSGRGPPNHPPYIISLLIDGVENCHDPDRTYFERKPLEIAHLCENAPDKLCGRRRVNIRYTELIVHGSATKAGDWPWHAALMRYANSNLKYTCGGTLISKYAVLTAAHCVALHGVPLNPELLLVVLGKYSLYGKDVATQEKEVFKVIIHESFQYNNLDNDIAVLKLTSAAIYNNHVQPACLWFDGIYDHLESRDINGTVVGWGFDSTDSLSTNLKEATMPQVPDLTCIRFDPTFYSNVLNGNKFCAGYRNGTTACNGDSGGGFLVFVQDDLSINYSDKDYIDGAWYVKGIVSVTLARTDASVCDPKAYSVFTDIAVYRDWILKHTRIKYNKKKPVVSRADK